MGLFNKRAERERFELSVETSPTTVFETVPLNRSGTSPNEEIITYVQQMLVVLGRILSPPDLEDGLHRAGHLIGKLCTELLQVV